jgi:imidazolonepropionase-like amidohydrolase
LRAGATITVGSETHNTGEDTFQELLAFRMGGMTHAEILRAATLNGARGVGVDADLGSIEVGKIADLVVLDGNPLDDIMRLLQVHVVVQDGFAYDGRTLDRIWPSAKPFVIQPWMKKWLEKNASGSPEAAKNP